MALSPLILLVPSRAAAVEWPRRIAASGRATAGLYPFKILDLARALAEPALLGQGLAPWDAGHDALLATRLLEGEHGLLLPGDVPLRKVAAALARTLSSLRGGGLLPAALSALAASYAGAADDRARLTAIAALYRRFHGTLEERFADRTVLLRAAAARIASAPWLRGAHVLLVEEPELDPPEARFLAAVAAHLPVEVARGLRPPGLPPAWGDAFCAESGIAVVRAADTVLAAGLPAVLPPGLQRLRATLFAPPAGEAEKDGSVSLLTAPGEAAEVRTVLRRLLRAASAGVPFEDMALLLPRPDTYAPLVADLLSRLGVPHRMHPSLPLRTGRASRSLLLLLRCRGLARRTVMEFLTFAPVPFAEMLGDDVPASPAVWDRLSRDAGIVSGLERWMIGLRHHAERETEAADQEREEGRRARRLQEVRDAEALLRIVEILSGTLDGLSGEASWPDWSARLRQVFEQWVGPAAERGQELERQAVLDVLADLGGLASLAPRAPWSEVESVLEARFEWERVPLEPQATGALHVGALDALAGLPFRYVAILGLVEGGYPPVLRPDPFLLDPEREALAAAAPDAPAVTAPTVTRQADVRRQMSLFDQDDGAARTTVPPPVHVLPAVPTTRDRLREERRAFHRALSQATEHLVLSYPRADARSGRERLPSAFFVAAASALAGRPLAALDLAQVVEEDDLVALPLEEALDRSERDRARIRRDPAAADAIAGGCFFFKQARLASRSRWDRQLTAYDGLVAWPPGGEEDTALADSVRKALDPTASGWPVSASRLATFAQCGFRYMLQYVLRLEPALEPQERTILDPLERGTLFHDVAERLLRELRDTGGLPLRDDEETRARALAMAGEGLDALVAHCPPRYTFLWERERARFREAVLSWLRREAGSLRSAPAYFELSFGMGARTTSTPEPHDPEPLAVELGDGRTLRLSGKIDRIDRRPDGQTRAPRLQDRPRPLEGRRRAVQGRAATADPLLRAGGGEAPAGDPGGGGVPGLRGRRTAGELRRGGGHRRALPCAPARHARRHRPGALRAGAHLLHLVRLHGGVRPAPAARAAPAVQDHRSAPPAGPAPPGLLVSTRSLPIDEAARIRARTEHATSFVLEAGAGTGKTTLLVDRIEAMVRSGHARLEEIAAVTFTENAAATMKLRLRERLERARVDPQAGAVERARAAEALEALDRAQISTIHALCAAILGERPLECGVAPGFRVADEAEADLLFQGAWEEWLGERLVEGDPVIAESLDAGILLETERGPGDRFSLRGFARTLIEQRDLVPLCVEDAVDPVAWRSELALQVREIPRLLLEVARDDTLAAGLLALARFFEEARFLATAPLLRHLSGLGSVVKGLHGGSGNKTRWRSPDALVQGRALASWAKTRAAEWTALAGASLHGRLVRALARVGDIYARRKAEESVLDFVDLLLRARNALRDRATVRTHFRARFKALIIDEFQDTDPLQVEVAELLSGGVPGALVVVGDAKQSIYRFRRAEVALFRRLSARGGPGGARPPPAHSELPLARSHPALREPGLRRDHHGLRGGRTAGLRAHPPGGRPGRRAWRGGPALRGSARGRRGTAPPRGARAGSVPGRGVSGAPSACAIPRPGKRARAAPATSSSWPGASPRASPRGSAVRVRRAVRDRGREVVLRSPGGARGFRPCCAPWRTPPIGLSLVAALRSSFFGVSDRDLVAYVVKGGTLLLEADETDRPGAPALSPALGLLRELNRRRTRDSVPALLERLTTRLVSSPPSPAPARRGPGGEPREGGDAGPGRRGPRRAHAARVRGPAGRAHRPGRARKPDPPDTRPGDPGAVRILTIHKAKGLEAPVVALFDSADDLFTRPT